MSKITTQATINAPVQRVWELYTTPEHVTQWNNASDDWHSPRAENDLRVGGKFLYRMEAKDGSAGFDFEGIYTDVKEHERIAYSMSDGRTVEVTFTDQGNETTVTVAFDPEQKNSLEMQRAGWQSILDNFKKYAESQREE